MPARLPSYLQTDAGLRVLRALSMSTSPKGVREVADLCGLSPRGAQLVLKRLLHASLVREERSGRKVHFFLDLSEEDLNLLHRISSLSERATLHDSALQYSKNTKEALGWIDQTLKRLPKRKES